jgi:hypothetical protein
MAKDPIRDKDWEPSEAERTWYRHALTADRGYLCRRNGRDMIRYDRPNDAHAIEQYEPGKWNIDREHRPLQALQTTLVAYAADQALCRALGLHEKQREWISLPEKMRIAWIKKGPTKPAIRGELYAAVREILKPLEG